EAGDVAAGFPERFVDTRDPCHGVLFCRTPRDASAAEAHYALEDALVDCAAHPDGHAAGFEGVRELVDALEGQLLGFKPCRGVTPQRLTHGQGVVEEPTPVGEV